MSRLRCQWCTIAFSGVCSAVAIAVCCVAGGLITASIQSVTWFQTCAATALSYSQSDSLMGWISAMVMIPVFKWFIVRLYESSSGGGLYGLDHAILNIEVPPKNLWLNM